MKSGRDSSSSQALSFSVILVANQIGQESSQTEWLGPVLTYGELWFSSPSVWFVIRILERIEVVNRGPTELGETGREVVLRCCKN